MQLQYALPFIHGVFSLLDANSSEFQSDTENPLVRLYHNCFHLVMFVGLYYPGTKFILNFVLGY